jgi:protein-tyrosine phosphatase
MTKFKFAAAAKHEQIVFGAARPGYSDRQINEWLAFMKNQNIQRVCCLLSATQLRRYSDLIGIYQQNFGCDHICWSPIEDFSLVDQSTLLHQILPFLSIAHQQNEKVVVHCSGGVGRTGHVLAAWLVAKYGLSNQESIAAVYQTGRNPNEAVIATIFKGRNPWQISVELHLLLNECRSNTLSMD